MRSAACARAASDLTTLVTRLDRTGRALDRQSRLPEEEFGGLSGDAYRRHAARSAVAAAGAASDVALLAGALAALGRELAAAEELRDRAEGSPPERSRELRRRAHELEQEAQDRWRRAVASYDGSAHPRQRATGQPVVAGHVLRPDTPTEPAAPTVPPTTDPHQAAPAPVAATPASEPVLESAFVTPPPPLEAELVVPPTPAAHCGTPEVIDEHR